MFGYTLPVESMLSRTDGAVYRSYYCETCHQLHDGYGLVSTAVVNYEMTFAAILLNSVTDAGRQVGANKKGALCVMRKGTMDTQLMADLAAYTVLLADCSLSDDIVDNPDLKSAMGKLVLGRAIDKAKCQYPEMHDMIYSGFQKLRSVEEAECDDPYEAGIASASSMIDVLSSLLGDEWDEDLERMFLHLGIWVYVLDAVEDLDDDFVDGTYNPFLVGVSDYTNKNDFIERNVYRITEVLNRIIGAIQSSFEALKPRIRMNSGIIENVVYSGIPLSTQRIMRGDRSMSASVKNAVDDKLNRKHPA